jgi:hemolysin-activating ACP:hemolysin acyltransferase
MGKPAKHETATVQQENASNGMDATLKDKFAGVKMKLHSTFGQVVLAMSAVARYRHMMLSELQQLVIDPLIKDKIVIALPASPVNDLVAATAPATIAIWASLSDDADQRVREQIRAGVFPVRLRAEDWASGDHVWLLDVIAPTEAMATEVLKNFRQVVRKEQISIHPIVKKLVSPDLLETMSSRAS